MGSGEGAREIDCEDEERGEILRRKVVESLADPRPSVPAEEVFARLRRLHGLETVRDDRVTLFRTND